MLPKPYISYSQYRLWKSDKDAFRRKYYEGEDAFETRETIFGKKIAKLLEENHTDFKHVPRFECPEFAIKVEVDGVLLWGYLDSFCPRTYSILEYKTGHKNKDGKPPWDAVKVRKHEQLVFYSLLVKKKFGEVNNKCRLVWLETEFKKKEKIVFGRVIQSDSTELQLTGKMEIFDRRIYEWERKKLVADIKKVVKEISEDYETYKKRNITSDVAAREVKPQEAAAQ